MTARLAVAGAVAFTVLLVGGVLARYVSAAGSGAVAPRHAVVVAATAVGTAVCGCAGAWGLGCGSGRGTEAAAGVAVAFAVLGLAWHTVLVALYSMTSSVCRRRTPLGGPAAPPIRLCIPPSVPPAAAAAAAASAAPPLHVDFVDAATVRGLWRGCDGRDDGRPAPGRLGMCAAPGRTGAARLQDDARALGALLGAGGCVVTLLEARDMDAAGTRALPSALRDAGLSASLHFPVRDKWLPRCGLGPPYLALARDVAALVDAGVGVVVHCNGGKGRTGTLVVCVLMAAAAARGERLPLRVAVRLVRAARPGTIRNPLQLLFCAGFSRAYERWASSAARPRGHAACEA